MGRFVKKFDFDSFFRNESRKIASDIVDDIRSSWTGGTNSPPGKPPAKDTGTLDRSIYSQVWENGKSSVIRVGSDEDYASALEFGTSEMSPRPFLRPQLMKQKLEPKFKDIL